jgi:hypothetical protein
MAGNIKRSPLKDERVVYADPPKIRFWAVWAYIIFGFLLLPLFALYLIVWLVLYKLRIIRPARNPPQWGSRQAGQDGPFNRSSPR